MRLVRDDHDVFPFGQKFKSLTLFGGKLLDGGKHHPAAARSQKLFQFGAAFRLFGRLAQQGCARVKGSEQLVVQVVAVGDHDNSGVRHVRMDDQQAGVKHHGERLAASLGVPHHPRLAVSRGLASHIGQAVSSRLFLNGGVLANRPQGRFNGFLHRVILMIRRYLLDGLDAYCVGGGIFRCGFLKDREMARKIKQHIRAQHALDKGFQLGRGWRVFLFSIHGFPLHETVPACRQGTCLRVLPV